MWALLCLLLGHHTRLCPAFDVSLSVEATHVEPFISFGGPPDPQPNRLFCLNEGRKGEALGLIRADDLHSTALAATLGATPRSSMAPHFVNETHLAYVEGHSHFDTDAPLPAGERRTLVLLNVPDGTRRTVDLAHTLHHDARFYPETETFFVLIRSEAAAGAAAESRDTVVRAAESRDTGVRAAESRDTVARAAESRDTVAEVGLDGAVVWAWRPAEAPDLPRCMGFAVPWGGAVDCHHINAVHYVARAAAVYVSMRSLAGFAAVHRPTGAVLWVFSNIEPPEGFQRTPRWIDVCPGHRVPWPRDTCKMYGFHHLTELEPNLFHVFANCDSSVRLFSIARDRADKRCLNPVLYVSGPKLAMRRNQGFGPTASCSARSRTTSPSGAGARRSPCSGGRPGFGATRSTRPRSSRRRSRAPLCRSARPTTSGSTLPSPHTLPVPPPTPTALCAPWAAR